MIVIIPTSGLANRMRAIDSAMALAKHANHQLQILWVKDSLLNCRFSELFQPIDGIEIIECNRLPWKYKESKIGNLYLPSLIRTLLHITFYKKSMVKDLISCNTDFDQLVSDDKHITLVSNLRFYPNDPPYLLFEPTNELNILIAKETAPFNAFTIGVHIRRTDNVKAIEKSPIELFEKVIQEELNRDDRHNFYLASDSEEVKNAMVEKFGDKMMMSSKMPGRRSAEDIQQGLIELFALSKTKKVYGSYWSSFSHTACHLSGIEEITVYQD